MASIRMIHPAREITALLTEGCTVHLKETHHDLLKVFRGMDERLAIDISEQCRSMSPVERSLVERAIVVVGLDTMPLYASPYSHPRVEAAQLVITLMPLAMEITRSFYCPELPMEALDKDISLKSHCVHSVTNFLHNSIDSHAPVWRDKSLIRGRYLLDVCDGFTGQPSEETRWIGEHSIELATHVAELQSCTQIDRAYCASLLTTTAPLLNGIL